MCSSDLLYADEGQTAPVETVPVVEEVIPIEEIAEAEAPDAAVGSGVVEESALAVLAVVQV